MFSSLLFKVRFFLKFWKLMLPGRSRKMEQFWSATFPPKRHSVQRTCRELRLTANGQLSPWFLFKKWMRFKGLFIHGFQVLYIHCIIWERTVIGSILSLDHFVHQDKYCQVLTTQCTWVQSREGEREGGNVPGGKDAFHVSLHEFVDNNVAARIQFNVGVSLE